MNSSDNKEMKTCKKCGEQKPTDEFYSNRSKGVKGPIVYLSSWCKTCTYAHNKEAKQRNREKHLQYHKDYNAAYYSRMTPEKKAQLILDHRKWRDKNRDKSRAKYNETARSKYREHHPDYRKRLKDMTEEELRARSARIKEYQREYHRKMSQEAKKRE